MAILAGDHPNESVKVRNSAPASENLTNNHRFWYQSKAHIYDFLLVIDTNLPPILHRFQVMGDYWSNFS